MDKQKLDSILNELEGITQLDWQKLKICVDTYFRKKSSQLNNKIQLADKNYVVEEFKYYSSTI